MKLEFKFDRKTLIKIACLGLLFLVLPFSFELVFLIDIGGLDFALTFFMLYLGSTYYALLEKWVRFKQELASFVVFVGQRLRIEVSVADLFDLIDQLSQRLGHHSHSIPINHDRTQTRNTQQRHQRGDQ